MTEQDPTPAKPPGEAGQPGSDIRHGTLSGYQTGRCRCEACTRVKQAQRRRLPTRSVLMSSEEAKFCQICRLRLTDHPLKACWREVR